MAGTSKGVKNSWATRREKYGPSGRAPKDESRTRAKSGANESKDPAPSRYMNKNKRDVRVLNGARVPADHVLESMSYEREQLVDASNKFNRYKKTRVWAELPAYVRDTFQQAQKKRTAAINQLNRAIKARQEALIAEDRKKYGRRY